MLGFTLGTTAISAALEARTEGWIAGLQLDCLEIDEKYRHRMVFQTWHVPQRRRHPGQWLALLESFSNVNLALEVILERIDAHLKG